MNHKMEDKKKLGTGHATPRHAAAAAKDLLMVARHTALQGMPTLGLSIRRHTQYQDGHAADQGCVECGRGLWVSGCEGLGGRVQGMGLWAGWWWS